MVRRLRRKRLVRPANEGRLLLRSNQEWALDFACDALETLTKPPSRPVIKDLGPVSGSGRAMYCGLPDLSTR
jgi:hypothetical protein